MKPAERELAKIVLLQVGYFCLAVAAGYVAYLIEGEIDVQGTWGTWKLGGAVAAFVAMLLVLIATGPHTTLLKRFRELSEHEIEEELRLIDAHILLRPRKGEEYDRLFDGFTKSDFVAFNAPFRMEARTKRVTEDALRVQLRRYEEEVTSRYLFYDRDSYERAVRFFTKLQEPASQQGISLIEMIEIQYSPTQHPPTYTYFAGYRSRVPRCIFYPSATLEDGMPDAVIIIDEMEDLLDILVDHFDEQWIRAQESRASESWPPESES